MWKVIIEYVNEQGNSIVDTVASGIAQKIDSHLIGSYYAEMLMNLQGYEEITVRVEHYIL